MITSPSIEIKQIISTELAWKYAVIPKSITETEVVFYIDENSEQSNTENILQILLRKKVVFIPLPSEEIKKSLGLEYRRASASSVQSLKINSERFLDDLIAEAASLESSDIHLEIQENNARIRFRIDGVLIEKYAVPQEKYPSLVNKIKIKANLNISEKRLPQDGRIMVKNGKTSTDIRVSVLPTLHGEKIVLRLLSKDSTNIHLNTLGMSPKQYSDYSTAIQNPHGIILISGPTGSGKTTTLYATLKELNDTIRNIITIEDPIEYTLDGINQVQLREAIGLDFSKAIKTFLRQDPDVIMLGEIRDGETAQMAVRAALTGHLVFSTIHTNSAWGILTRLTDMGVPAYLLANTINMVLAQRLVRALCTRCKTKSTESKPWPKTFKKIAEHKEIYEPVGCPECHQTGYRGRLSVYEVITIDRELQEKVRNTESSIDEYMSSKEITNLADNTLDLLFKGKTSFAEALPILLSYSK